MSGSWCAKCHQKVYNYIWWHGKKIHPGCKPGPPPKPKEPIIKAIFHYSDGSTRTIQFPNMPKVAGEVRKDLTIEPILVYFKGRLSPENERSVATCQEFTRWQHWCLRQTRSFQV